MNFTISDISLKKTYEIDLNFITSINNNNSISSLSTNKEN